MVQRSCSDDGISYGGFTALQVAALAPPHLVAIVPVDFTDNRYTDDCHYVGGLLRMYHDTGVLRTFMVAFDAMPPDPSASGAEWSRIWQQHLEENTPYMLRWLRHQKPGDYWLSGSVGPVASEIRCAVFMIGGWHDGDVNPPLRLWPQLNVPKRLLIGPWDHDVPDTGIPGPRIDYMPEVVGWLDQWCVPGAPEHEHHPLAMFVEHYSPPDADMREATGHWRTKPTGHRPICSRRLSTSAPPRSTLGQTRMNRWISASTTRAWASAPDSSLQESQ